jgi:hypothetical protein
MQLHKAQLQQFVHDLPDTVEADEVMYRIYLMQKIEEGEEDIRQGQIISHDDLRARLAKRCLN